MILPGKMWAALLAAVLLAPLAAEGANALSELRGLRTRESRIPVYSKDRLQLLLYGEECFQKGRLLEMTSPVLDIIRPDADIDTIDTGKNTRIYPLGAPFADVLKFWSGHLFSDGVVVTGKADIDQEHKIAAGGGPVFFRSPLLDLNGVGFDADYGKKTIFVRKDVQIVLRTAASDPFKIVKNGKMPEKYEFLRGTSDNMQIDMTRRVITLTGRVRVLEDRGTIDCERMLIILPPEKGRKKKGQDDDFGIKGVSQVICEGRVRIERTGGTEPQRAFCERMVYDLDKGLLRMTGTVAVLPVMVQGKNLLQGRRIDIYRNDERMQILQDCKLVYFQKDSESGKMQPVQATSDRMDFDNRKNFGVLTGNVRVIEPRFALQCRRMDIRLAETAAPDKKQKAAVSDITGIPEFAPGGKKELKNMHCYGDVRLIRPAAAGEVPETATAHEAEMTYPEQVITMSGNRPVIAKGKDSISGDKLVIDLQSQSLVAEPRSHIVFSSDAGKSAPVAGKKTAGVQKTEVFADRADLKYGQNLLIFIGNVKVVDPRMTLDCRRMDIYLKDAAPSVGKAKKKIPADASLASIAGPDGRKVLDKIVCIGDVKAREPRMKMDCDKLTLVFRPAADPAKSAPGMFQSHGTELTYIYSDGNVVLENIPEKKTASAEKTSKNAVAGMPSFSSNGAMHMTADRGVVDLVRNITEFHGNVKVREEQGQLDCQDLYLYAKNVEPAKGKKTPEHSQAGLDDLDDDPFAKVDAKQVPQVITLGEGKELDRVVALKDVLLVRKLAAGGEQRASGQKAEYFVSRRLVELTGDAPNYAQVSDVNPQNNGRSRKITVFLDREAVAFDGRVQMEFDAKKGTPGVDL